MLIKLTENSLIAALANYNLNIQLIQSNVTIYFALNIGIVYKLTCICTKKLSFIYFTSELNIHHSDVRCYKKLIKIHWEVIKFKLINLQFFKNSNIFLTSNKY